jgi:hypothetical protein
MQPDQGIGALANSPLNWVDVCSLTLAVIYGVTRSLILKQRLISRGTGLGIASGIGLFPLVLLVASTYWNAALVAVLQSNKVILSLAGVVALITLLEDFIPAKETQGAPQSAPQSPPAVPSATEDVITWILGLSGSLSERQLFARHDLSYAQTSDILLFNALHQEGQRRQPCIIGLKVLLSIGPVANESIAKIRENLKILGVEYSDTEFEEIRKEAASGENLTFGTLANRSKPAETQASSRYHPLRSHH